MDEMRVRWHPGMVLNAMPGPPRLITRDGWLIPTERKESARRLGPSTGFIAVQGG
jgi:hypothetical protein